MRKEDYNFETDITASINSVMQCISDVEKLQEKIEGLPSEESIKLFLKVCSEIECQFDELPIIEKELIVAM